MSTQRRQIFEKAVFSGLIAWVALGGVVSCSSIDEAPGGGRVAHPVEPSPKASAVPVLPVLPSPSAMSPTVPSGSASAPSQVNEAPLEPSMSPMDKAIREDYPARPWSKNVPKRGCAKDEECGDGFCDRGRCAAIWTWSAVHGQRCTKGDQCADYLCMDGRCRSCVSDAECVDEPGNQNPKCMPDTSIAGARECFGVAPSLEGDAVPNPSLEAPKK